MKKRCGPRNSLENKDGEWNNCFSTFCILFSITTYLVDVGTDVYLAWKYATDEHWWYFALTLIFIILPGFVMSIWAGKQYWRKWKSERRRIAAQPECLLELQSPVPDGLSEEDYSNALNDHLHNLKTIKKKHFGSLNLMTDKDLVQNMNLRLDPLFKLEFLNNRWNEVYFLPLDNTSNRERSCSSDDRDVNMAPNDEESQHTASSDEESQHTASSDEES